MKLVANLNRKLCVTWKLVLVALSLHAISSEAVITPLAWYKLGEDDPGAVAGNTGNATTLDSVGSNHLTREGTPQYSASTGYLSGSTLSMSFGTGNAYRLTPNANVTALTQGVGMEAWVKANTVNSTDAFESYIVYNGQGGSSGYGFIQSGPSLGSAYGKPAVVAGHFYAQLGPEFVDLGPVVVGQWTHLGLTLDPGTGFATGYRDGLSLGTTNQTASTPGNFFAISSYTVSPAEQFNGNIDQVRLFSYAGAFNTADFLIIPEPSSAMLLGVGGVLLYRRRRRLN